MRDADVDLEKVLESYYTQRLTQDGSRSYCSKAELEELDSRLPRHLTSDLRLPFVFLRNCGLGEGVYSI